MPHKVCLSLAWLPFPACTSQWGNDTNVSHHALGVPAIDFLVRARCWLVQGLNIWSISATRQRVNYDSKLPSLSMELAVYHSWYFWMNISDWTMNYHVPALLWFRFCAMVPLTHLSLDKVATIWQTTLSIIFWWRKIFLLRFKFHWSLFPILANKAALVATSHYLNKCRPSSRTHKCSTRGRQDKLHSSWLHLILVSMILDPGYIKSGALIIDMIPWMINPHLLNQINCFLHYLLLD